MYKCRHVHRSWPIFVTPRRYLAITLARLEDFENATSAYDKAIEMETDHLFHLNYAITLFNNNQVEHAREQFELFERVFRDLDEESRNSDPEVLENQDVLRRLLSQAGS